MAAGSPIWARKLWATQDRFPIDASEPWGRLERVAEGIWEGGIHTWMMELRG